MIKKFLITILFTLVLSGGANAWYNFGEYKVMLKTKPLIIKEYVYGLGSGLRFGVDEICPPENLKLNTQNYISIIDDYGNKNNTPDNELIAGMLYVGLKLMFPC